jgi:hypothetical protein
MSNPILIIDKYLEVDLIEKQYPDLVGISLILLSSNFLPQHETPL